MQIHHEICTFLYWEATLLEENRFEQWLDCLAEDIRYWMPVRERVQGQDCADGAPDAAQGFAIYDDDIKSLRTRVHRIRTGRAHAEVPPSVTQRLITNVAVRESPAEGADTYAVRSTFQVFQERRGLHDVVFHGRRDDTLRRADGDFRIARRRIILAQEILPTTLSIFL
jgi:3-phenylpropionate/cinnamic acid dioxygenase small subunit